jgi:hypothetical protein
MKKLNNITIYAFLHAWFSGDQTPITNILI